MNAQFSQLQSSMKLRPGSMASQVLQFMVAFEQIPVSPLQRIPAEDFKLAEALIKEELKEMVVGFEKLETYQSLENLTEFVDGAIDSIYVILWAMLKFGVPVDACFAEIQRSNMAKLHNGKVVKYPEGHPKAGKVMKPDSWTAPNLEEILLEAGDDAVYNSAGFRKDA